MVHGRAIALQTGQQVELHDSCNLFLWDEAFFDHLLTRLIQRLLVAVDVLKVKVLVGTMNPLVGTNSPLPWLDATHPLARLYRSRLGLHPGARHSHR